MDEVRTEQTKIQLLKNSLANQKLQEIKANKMAKEKEDSDKFDIMEKRDWEWKVLREEQESIKLADKNRAVRDALDQE